mmetsp:Transcript_32122/g.63293  ORF Transcript_32122/g.63293 Transcript_32122/m.63293 type:complete len:327 (-) Transcript_32122:345-1325(-)
MARLETDVDYLASKKLMDYSLLVYGSIIELDHDDPASQAFFAPSLPAMPRDSPYSNGAIPAMQKLALQQAVRLAPQCGMTCSARPRMLVDITKKLQQTGESHYYWSGKSYRCCCVELKPGDSALVHSPCALVQLSAEGKTDCGHLFGSRFHAYKRSSVGGRCLIEWDQWPDIASLDLTFLSGRTVFEHSGSLNSHEQLTLQQRMTLSRVESCAVMCISVADYLLQDSTWKTMENIAMIPIYGGLKWSDYDVRTVRLLRCLVGGQPPTHPQSEDKKRPGLLKLFLPQKKPHPLLPNELTWNDCTNEFPEVRVLDDMEVVKQLVQRKL